MRRTPSRAPSREPTELEHLKADVQALRQDLAEECEKRALSSQHAMSIITVLHDQFEHDKLLRIYTTTQLDDFMATTSKTVQQTQNDLKFLQEKLQHVKAASTGSPLTNVTPRNSAQGRTGRSLSKESRSPRDAFSSSKERDEVYFRLESPQSPSLREAALRANDQMSSLDLKSQPWMTAIDDLKKALHKEQNERQMTATESECTLQQQKATIEKLESALQTGFDESRKKTSELVDAVTSIRSNMGSVDGTDDVRVGDAKIEWIKMQQETEDLLKVLNCLKKSLDGEVHERVLQSVKLEQHLDKFQALGDHLAWDSASNRSRITEVSEKTQHLLEQCEQQRRTTEDVVKLANTLKYTMDNDHLETESLIQTCMKKIEGGRRQSEPKLPQLECASSDPVQFDIVTKAHDKECNLEGKSHLRLDTTSTEKGFLPLSKELLDISIARVEHSIRNVMDTIHKERDMRGSTYSVFQKEIANFQYEFAVERTERQNLRSELLALKAETTAQSDQCKESIEMLSKECTSMIANTASQHRQSPEGNAVSPDDWLTRSELESHTKLIWKAILQLQTQHLEEIKRQDNEKIFMKTRNWSSTPVGIRELSEKVVPSISPAIVARRQQSGSASPMLPSTSQQGSMGANSLAVSLQLSPRENNFSQSQMQLRVTSPHLKRNGMQASESTPLPTLQRSGSPPSVRVRSDPFVNDCVMNERS